MRHVSYRAALLSYSIFPYLISWFDTDKMITACSGSKAKKMSKKEEPWRLSDKSLSLFCLPNNDEFDLSTVPTPYVCMQPVDDSKAGHDLIKDIIVHKVATILMAKGFCFTASPSDLGQLKKDYFRIKSDMERWYVVFVFWFLFVGSTICNLHIEQTDWSPFISSSIL